MLKRLAIAAFIVLALAAPRAWGFKAEQPAGHGEATAVEPAAGAAAGAADAHGPKHELLEFDRNAAIWTVLVFLILLAILYPTAWKGVLAGLKSRENRIRKDIADAEAARAKAEATLREYNAQLAEAENKVRQMIASAVAQGEQVAADIRQKAQQEAEEHKTRATAEIETAKNQALAQIYERAAELSTSIAAKILRRNLNADDQRDLVRQSLEQLQTVKS